MIETISKQKISHSKVCSLYENGLTIKEIADMHKISVTPIKRILKTYNIAIRSNSESHQKYTIDTSYFKKIDTYNKAYLLGFLVADGFVTNRNEIGIGVATKDIAVVEFFQREMKSNKPIRKIPHGVELRIQNQEMYQDILKLGIYPNKSLTINIQDVIEKANIQKQFLNSFLLGYFDGDGGIYKYDKKGRTIQYSCSIVGTYETCMFFKKYFNDIGFFIKRHKDSKNNYTYQIGGRNKVYEGLSHIYKDIDKLSFFFERKYHIYKELSKKSPTM